MIGLLPVESHTFIGACDAENGDGGLVHHKGARVPVTIRLCIKSASDFGTQSVISQVIS